ncbi:hypothetical protein VPH234P6_0206 [Vibrio phage 234P6]
MTVITISRNQSNAVLYRESCRHFSWLPKS